MRHPSRSPVGRTPSQLDELRWCPWDGDGYQARFDERAALGANVHGEFELVMTLRTQSVVDVGCGTGRVARELAPRGIGVVGVDADASMIATARRLGPNLTWYVADMCELGLARRFDVIVMAGNVPLFAPAGTQAALVAGCARHLTVAGAIRCPVRSGALTCGAIALRPLMSAAPVRASGQQVATPAPAGAPAYVESLGSGG